MTVFVTVAVAPMPSEADERHEVVAVREAEGQVRAALRRPVHRPVVRVRRGAARRRGQPDGGATRWRGRRDREGRRQERRRRHRFGGAAGVGHAPVERVEVRRERGGDRRGDLPRHVRQLVRIRRDVELRLARLVRDVLVARRLEAVVARDRNRRREVLLVERLARRAGEDVRRVELAGPELFEEERLAPRGRGRPRQERLERAPVREGERRDAGEVRERLREVDVRRVLAPRDARRDSGAADDERHVDVGLVRRVLAREQPVLAHVVAVVRREDEVRVREAAGGRERSKRASRSPRRPPGAPAGAPGSRSRCPRCPTAKGAVSC